jgi:DNA-3-methyladenine glycosylase II
MNETEFVLEPEPPFRLDLTVWTLRRRPENVVDGWHDATYRRMLPLAEGPVEVAVTQIAIPAQPQLQVRVVGAGDGTAMHAAVVTALQRLLGIGIDLSGFCRFAEHSAALRLMERRFRGMKPSRYATVFESLINGIACQQVTLTFGIRLLNRLAEAYGLRLRHSPVAAFPRPEDLAGANVERLRSLGFNRQKSRAIVEIARATCDGRWDAESLDAMPDDAALASLQQLHGVGRWTAEYVLLRGLGRLHIFPGDDVGFRNNLRRWLNVAGPLDYEDVQRIVAGWKPYAGLTYFHLLLDHLSEMGCLS